MKFTKMEAYGNDFIFINATKEKLNNLNELAKFITNRNFGVGADGLVLVCTSDKADFKMRIFNPDGSEAEMCGNALRSLGKYVYDYKLTTKKNLKIETLGGIKTIELTVVDNHVSNIKANIGKPIFASKLIPVVTTKDQFIKEKVDILDKTFLFSSLSWGNPHAVIFVHDIDNFDIAKYGPAIENKTLLFPKKTNVTFAEVITKNHLKIREWERGIGETLGCATGCASAVVISNILGLTSNKCTVDQKGGSITIEINPDGTLMIGPSNFVFEGDINVSHIIGGK